LTPAGPDTAVQQIDFILASDTLANEMGYVFGEIGGFADSWEMSDHVPVVADFN
jgi:exonuclease III